MKKIMFIVLFLIFLSSQLLSLSLLGAQNISRNYILENEMIDTYTKQKITCDSDDFFVIPVVNSLGEPIFFIPISIDDSQVYLSRTDSFNIKIVKTEYLLKELINSDPKNYLSNQMIDRLDTLISTLKSKEAQLQGVSNRDYSFQVKEQITITINNINNLISLLEDLKSNLIILLQRQNSFIQSPNCNDIIPLLNSFNTSFKGYNELLQSSQRYIESTNTLITKITSDDKIPPQEVQGVINLVNVPGNLNSSVSSLSESLSSTSSFYGGLHNKLHGREGDNKIKIYVDNLFLRIDYIKLRNSLERHDSTFPNYSNLESVVKTILNPEYRYLWKEQEEVNNVNTLYNDILEHSNKAEYSQALNKVSILKSKSKIILDEGFIEYEEELNWVYYLIVGVSILGLIILLIFLKRKGSNKASSVKKYKVKKKSKEDSLDVFDFKDPF